MNKSRIRITPFIKPQNGVDWISAIEVNAEHRKTGKRGTMFILYVPDRKYKEMIANGFAYINQYSHYIV